MSRTVITCIVLDGFHRGHVVRMSGYLPVIRLLKPRTTTIDYCCGGDEISTDEPEYVEYKICFTGVDGDVALYSESGKSYGILGMFNWETSRVPWTWRTSLKVGYHNEPIIQDEDGSQMTEEEVGYRRGVRDGKILQAREMRNKLKL